MLIQDDRFDTDSVTVCRFATDPTDAPLFQLPIEAGLDNGLAAASRSWGDKITTVRRTKLAIRIGMLNDADVVRLNRAMVVFLGIAAYG